MYVSFGKYMNRWLNNSNVNASVMCPQLVMTGASGKIIVKPWSKSWSQQAPKSNISQIKRKKKDLDLGLTPKSHGPPTQLKKINQMDSENKDVGKSYMFEKFINQP